VISRTRALLAAAAAGVVCLAAAGALAAAPGPAGTVTFVAGEATRTAAGGKAVTLAAGAPVFQGDVLETQKRTRLEVKLADGSVVRLGPSSRAEVQAAAFGKSVEERKVSAKLIVGKVWANVAKAVGGEQRFEVKTENAVAGVRGTTFRVDAATDRSVVVKVYSGTVAVASGTIPRPEHEGPGVQQEQDASGAKPKPARTQIAGPRQVTREQWEKIVTNMMEVRVSADGTPSEPERFAIATPGEDEWEEWNRTRDQAM
jgi:ferric-dicitrate binding protein FerR (iron transport regulator)